MDQVEPAAGPAPDEEPVEIEPPLSMDRSYPSTIGGLFYLMVLLATAVGITVVSAYDWRLGVRVISGGLAGAALLRLLLPQRDAGMLAVRHRLIDVLLLAGVGAALFFLAGSIPDQP